ncbi:hypothetical protein FHR83_008803 [Actinoplanes campanulatus]|uniref:Uncharacterized protein n=1 Tax=Actinoplanes campanulatus TaxID=113559 RepID=A0A7W5ARP2_9ACTN|nr:hypothetical protein [Actinoplanes campanulatus]
MGQESPEAKCDGDRKAIAVEMNSNCLVYFVIPAWLR